MRKLIILQESPLIAVNPTDVLSVEEERQSPITELPEVWATIVTTKASAPSEREKRFYVDGKLGKLVLDKIQGIDPATNA